MKNFDVRPWYKDSDRVCVSKTYGDDWCLNMDEQEVDLLIEHLQKWKFNKSYEYTYHR